MVWFRASCTVAPVGDDRVSVLQWHLNQPPSWGPDWWFSSVAREDLNALLQKPDFLICHYCVSSSPWFQLALGCTAKKGTSLSWHFVIAIALEMSYHWTIHITFCGSAVLISQSISTPLAKSTAAQQLLATRWNCFFALSAGKDNRWISHIIPLSTAQEN